MSDCILWCCGYTHYDWRWITYALKPSKSCWENRTWTSSLRFINIFQFKYTEFEFKYSNFYEMSDYVYIKALKYVRYYINCNFLTLLWIEFVVLHFSVMGCELNRLSSHWIEQQPLNWYHFIANFRYLCRLKKLHE